MKRIAALILILALVLAGCGSSPAAQSADPGTPPPASSAPGGDPAVTDPVDYAAAAELDLSSRTLKQEVTVKGYVDGDTTHFFVPEDVMPGGVLKARYLAINTPESTGKIEEYGKAASRFTREKLSSAESIIIESDDESWHADSTGDRYLVWVWYRAPGETAYRNLNIEILQNGLAIANSAANNRYGHICTKAIDQARAMKLNVYSGQKDPDFYYGEAVELTLKELRCNMEQYNGVKVAFTGIISANSGTQGVYVEDYDPETDLYFGIYIYYGHGLTGAGLDVLSVGNEARIAGTVQYYEGGGTWQVSDLSYRLMKPDDPNNIQKLSDGHSASYRLTEPDVFAGGTVTLQLEEGELTAPYASLVMGTSVELKGLRVVDIYTTTDADSSSKGAMTLTCEKDGVTVTVRTAVLLDENGKVITADAYAGQIIDVKGIVDSFDGACQIKVFSPNHITIVK